MTTQQLKNNIYISILKNDNSKAKELLVEIAKKHHVTIKNVRSVKSEKLKLKYFVEFIQGDNSMSDRASNLFSQL